VAAARSEQRVKSEQVVTLAANLRRFQALILTSSENQQVIKGCRSAIEKTDLVSKDMI
jgi:hypothetical protein